jgi:hypothetical protein
VASYLLICLSARISEPAGLKKILAGFSSIFYSAVGVPLQNSPPSFFSKRKIHDFYRLTESYYFY